MEDYIYKKIGSILFGVLSPEEIKKMACTKIVTPELYDKEGYPVDGGLMDIRLGVINPGLRCKTCGGKLKECMGHFGYIELARPIIHIKYMKTITDFLVSTCRICGRILLDENAINKEIEIMDKFIKEKNIDGRRKRAKKLIDYLKKVKKCPHCKEKKYSIKIEKPSTFYENEKRLSPIEIRARFEKISDRDVEILGLNPKYARPEWLALTVLLIPPVTMRPSITLETGERSEDDLTHKLSDIVRINQRLFENINAGAPEIIVEDLWDLLQYHITTYFDNTIAQIPPARHRSGQILKTLTERIKSKEGRFRHNLAGKRVNFAARTVISPEPNIKFNEVGVPKEIAMDLTVPERVTEWNIESLKKFIQNGPNIYVGANYVIRPDGKKKKITEETKEQLLEEIQPGYIVERHLMDGDISIFNRQPSLHKMSIMCHKIKIFPGKSFRLNPAVCFPYNADFDGDEMNLHIPQTEEARSEAEILMQVQTQIMTPKHGLNVIGCVQDAITGNYLLTKRIKLGREEAISLLSAVGVDDFSKLKKSIVTGKEIFSSVLPNDFNFYGYSKSCIKDFDKCKKEECPYDSYVSIRNGELISGIIDNSAIGGNGGLLIRELYKRYGGDKTLEIISKIFRLGTEVLLKKGFTTSIEDTDLPEDIILRIKDVIKDAQKEVDKFIEAYKKNEIERAPGKTIIETLEAKILEVLNKVRNKVGVIIAQHSKETNPTIIMARSGAVGNIVNLAQIAACVGQQALRGRRIEQGYKDRTLSLFKKGDLSPKAHGFVESSFKAGLNPVEFFFHAMTGRDALMDTALRTPKSGYLYRRLANALQDLKIEYDQTVRDANKSIIQFVYGDDGVDVSRTEEGEINIIRIIEEVVKDDRKV